MASGKVQYKERQMKEKENLANTCFAKLFFKALSNT